MKKYYSFLSCSWIFLSLSGCSSPIETETSLKKIQITLWLSTRLTLKTFIEETIPAFEEKYGIKVDLVQASTGELFKTEAEKNRL